MKLRAQLTTGWVDADIKHSLSASALHTRAEQAQTSYKNGLMESMHAALQNPPENPLAIYGLENLFRKRVKGSEPMKQFIGALADMKAPAGYAHDILCRIDAFAYSFLKGAKNLDFVLPCHREENKEFIEQLDQWNRRLTALADFERFGRRSTPLPQEQVDAYLAMRTIFTRASARDEIRTLATLLLSGPSTLKEVKEDLGLNYPLGQRTLAAFAALEVVEQQGDRYAINAKKLPLVVFFLREVIGLDLLQDIFPEGG